MRGVQLRGTKSIVCMLVADTAATPRNQRRKPSPLTSGGGMGEPHLLIENTKPILVIASQATYYCNLQAACCMCDQSRDAAEIEMCSQWFCQHISGRWYSDCLYVSQPHSECDSAL
jgi:hypothetical protein